MKPNDMTGIDSHVFFNYQTAYSLQGMINWEILCTSSAVHQNVWFAENSHTPALWCHNWGGNHQNMIFLLIVPGWLAMYMEENLTSKSPKVHFYHCSKNPKKLDNDISSCQLDDLGFAEIWTNMMTDGSFKINTLLIPHWHVISCHANKSQRFMSQWFSFKKHTSCANWYSYYTINKHIMFVYRSI